ncbi:hypothetical protein EVJ58_g6749 [Rhodofomes roseus]|uniref:Uncharacterized protein n=1 Tax=Rhodofomes roseus TaxID=34475 RepID=A0A4Y9Y7L2_9APHY|nr:hypothetical protein EVJ58_g6749 [Rhodofomes roseus]
MYHPLPLPRLHSRKHPRVDPCAASNARATERNSSPTRHGPRFPAPAGCTTKKAPPTLSVSNTNASRSGVAPVAFPSDIPEPPSQSIIPFPSAPIDFPVRRADKEDGLDACPEPEQRDGDEQNVPTGDKAEIRRDIDWRRVRRRCTQSCIASSCAPTESFSKEGPQAPRRPFVAIPVNNHPEPDTPDAKADPNVPHHRTRRHSVSAGCGPFRPSPRRARKVKKPTADTQYLAVVHRSIAWHARGARELRGELSACIEQDVELATRLWRALADRGCRPTSFKSVAPSPTPIADKFARSVPTSRSMENPTTDELADAQPTSPVPKIPDQLGPSSAPSVMTMPQLVASMTLRFRDRSSARPRSAVCFTSKDGEEDKPLRPRSALGHVVFSSGEGEEVAGAN